MRLKNLGKSAKVKYGPKLQDNARYQSKGELAIESIKKTSQVSQSNYEVFILGKKEIFKFDKEKFIWSSVDFPKQ
jgi:hypothetical protein